MLLIPMGKINRRLFRLETDETSYPPYESVRDQFEVTYEMTNPAYKLKQKRKRDLYLQNMSINMKNIRESQQMVPLYTLPFKQE